MEFGVDDLYEVVESIWLPTLEMAVQLHDAPLSQVELTELRTAVVKINGAWEGGVIIQCSEELLKYAASVMLAIDPAEPTAEDLMDTLCELVNMLGGTVKSMLPEPCSLTLPEVLNHPSEIFESPSWVNFQCHDEPLRVAVFEHTSTIAVAS